MQRSIKIDKWINEIEQDPKIKPHFYGKTALFYKDKKENALKKS